MNTKILMPFALLVAASACSSQQDASSQEQPALQQGSSLPVQSTGKVAAPVSMSPSQSALAAAAPVVAGSPATMSQPPAVSAMSGAPSVRQAPAAPVVSPGFADPAAAAAGSIATLADLVASDRPDKRGFGSLSEVGASTIADGMPVLFVRLDSLVAYKPGQDVKALLLDKKEVLFPISVAGDVRSSVTVSQRPDGSWEATQFGNQAIARSSHATRRAVELKGAVDTSGKVSLIEIPTVHAFFLAHTQKNVLMVTPLWDVPETSFKAGATLQAAQVFAALQPLAAQVDLTTPN